MANFNFIKSIINRQNKTKTKIQLKNDANMETLQPTKQNDSVAINKNYKVSNNERTANEDKNKQIHKQIKIHNEHLKNITKIDKYKKNEQHFYGGAQNRIQLHFGEPSNKHKQIQQRSNKRN